MPKEIVTVVGLGYVGLPLAVLAAKKGYTVQGLEQDTEKVEKINRGENFLQDEFLEEHFEAGMIKASTKPSILKKSDIVIVCVPTPVDAQYNPDLGPVRGAATAIIKNMDPEKRPLVIIESTINPGVCEEVVEVMFSEAGFKDGKHYDLAHCPERINPGDPKWNVSNIPRVAGAKNAKGLKRAVAFYESILDASVRPMKSLKEAEAAKVVENSFRDINIAFVNELARSFDTLGIDVVDVIAGAATKPFAFMPHWPSCGVGGHCIPVDPYYLIERAKLAGFDHKFLRTARGINNAMPLYTVELLQDKLNDVGLPMNGTHVGVLGVAYKANVGDLRESPAIPLMKHLRRHKAIVHTYDPYLPQHSTEKSVEALLRKCVAVVLVTDHREFLAIDPKIFQKHGIKVVVDGKNKFDKDAIEKLGIVYKGIGR